MLSTKTKTSGQIINAGLKPNHEVLEIPVKLIRPEAVMLVNPHNGKFQHYKYKPVLKTGRNNL